MNQSKFVKRTMQAVAIIAIIGMIAFLFIPLLN